MIISTARVLALCILAALAAGPAIAGIKSKRIYGPITRRLRVILVSYYVALLAVALFAFIPDLYARFRDLLGPLDDLLEYGLLIGFIGVPLIGPWLGGYVLGAGATLASGHCNSCGYDLTGNLSGVCPECGCARASDDSLGGTFAASLRAGPWKAVSGYWLVGCCILFLLAGIQRETAYTFCSDCARERSIVTLRIAFPFYLRPIAELRAIAGSSTVRKNPITRYLDPHDSCPHVWMDSGFDVTGVTSGVRSSRPSGAHCSIALEDDFEGFLAAHPGILNSFRGDLSNRKDACGMVFDLYFDWHDRVKRHESTGDDAAVGLKPKVERRDGNQQVTDSPDR